MKLEDKRPDRVPQRNAAASPLSARTLKAGQWRIASMAMQGVLQFAIGILLSRLLPPEDFGLAALAMVVIGFATMTSDLGLGPAVVQRKILTTLHLRVAFTTSLLLGLAIAASMAVAAPWIGVLARSAALPSIIRVESLLFAFGGVGTVARALLQRELDFRKLFIIEIVSYVVGYALVATVGALYGWGVWSLVAGSLVQSLLSSVMALAAVRVPLRPLLAGEELRQLLGFGVGVSVNGVTSYVARNGDNFFVGRLLGTTALGLYARAYNLMMMPLNYICSALPNVLLPAFAEVQADPARVGRGFIMSVQLTAMTTLPIMAGMFVAAPHMIRGLYGDRWSGAILPVQILCVVGLPRSVHSLAGAVNRACNRVYTELVLQIGFASAVVTGTIVGSKHGVAGVALFVAAAIVGMYVAMVRLALSITGETWRAFGFAQLPGLLLGACTATVATAVRMVAESAGLSHLAIFGLLVVASGASVPLGIYLLPNALRPNHLFGYFQSPVHRLPPRLRRGVLYVMAGGAS